MARKLKTYTTSAGFFDLAIAAPSMKAALEAWGSKRNLFHDGFARMSEDPDIVAATMARPGVVLRRPVGGKGPFSEHAELPSDLAIGDVRRPPAMRRTEARKPAGKPIDEKAARKAALAFERERQNQRRQAEREEAAREKEHQRRQRAIAAAQAALDDAQRGHDKIVKEIERARRALDGRAEAEEKRWQKKKHQLEEDLQKARSPRYLRLVER